MNQEWGDGGVGVGVGGFGGVVVVGGEVGVGMHGLTQHINGVR